MRSGRAPKRHRWTRRFIRGLAIATGLLIAAAPLALALVYSAVELPAEPPLAQTSIVYDAAGKELARFTQGQDRVLVSLDEVADVMEQAAVAAEDRSFWRHSGLDARGIARALWQDMRGGPLQGGSTITQQLVKNSWLTAERSVTRKLQEAVLAVKVEEQFSKREILERYLNTVYFGRGAYGIQAAARAYFGVDAAHLDLGQAALLAGLIRSPELADPATHGREATRRRNQVLDAMVTTGAIDTAEARRAQEPPVTAVPVRRHTEVTSPGRAYFVEAVRRWTIERYGDDVTYGGGLRIHTTLDSRLQTAAEQAVSGVLGQPGDPAAALVSIDDGGRVRAMVGGRGFATSQVNYALGRDGGGTGRQAGSTFKAVVLAAAIEAGISPRQRFNGPATMSFDTAAGPWEVNNYGGESFGSIDLYEATAKSVNTVYAQLIQQLGPERVVAMAKRLGITSPAEPVPSLVLGTNEVSPLEMTSAFMTLGARGRRTAPSWVERVTDAGGSVLYEHEPETAEALDAKHADVVNDILRGVVDGGTGTAARLENPTAGKTGTTQHYGDAWFVGYTPKLAAGVWMGYPEGQARAMTDVRGRSVTGGSFPAEIWHRFMEQAVQGVDTGDFVAPSNDALEGASDRPAVTLDITSSSSSSTSAPGSSTTTEPRRDDTSATTAPAPRSRGGGGAAPPTTTTTAPPTTTTVPASSTTTAPPSTTSTTTVDSSP